MKTEEIKKQTVEQELNDEQLGEATGGSKKPGYMPPPTEGD